MRYGEMESLTNGVVSVISLYTIKEESEIKKAEELISALIQLIKAQKEESGL